MALRTPWLRPMTSGASSSIRRNTSFSDKQEPNAPTPESTSKRRRRARTHVVRATLNCLQARRSSTHIAAGHRFGLPWRATPSLSWKTPLVGCAESRFAAHPVAATWATFLTARDTRRQRISGTASTRFQSNSSRSRNARNSQLVVRTGTCRRRLLRHVPY